MRILLIQPPIQDFYDTDIRLSPVGLGHLKAVAKKYYPAVEVIIRDYHHGWGRQTAAIPREFYYLKEYWGHDDQSPFCGFHHYYHFGASWEQITHDVSGIAPDAVGISSLFTPYFREVKKVAALVKAFNQQIPVLVGGSHASALPSEVLAHAEIDHVIVGEGERPFVEWIEYLLGKRLREQVANMGYKKSEQGQMSLHFNPRQDNFPLDELPYPDLSDFPLELYLFHKRPISFLITSRSCPHKCSFCSVHQTFGHNYRRRSVEHIFQEILQLNTRGYQVIDFEDDNLTFQRQDFIELCQRIIEAKAQGVLSPSLQLAAMNGISYLSLNREMLLLMRGAGFTHLNLALVSSDTSVRVSTKRPHTVEKYLEVLNCGHELGFQIVSYQILGLPFETTESMVQTLMFNAQLSVLLGASLFYLTPNSPIAKHFPALTEVDHFKARLTSMAWAGGEHFTRDDLYTLFRVTRMINFLKAFPPGTYSCEQDFLAQLGADRRQRLGVKQLLHFFTTGELYFEGRRSRSLDARFQSDLALNLFQGLHFIGALSGGKIVLGQELFQSAQDQKPRESRSDGDLLL